MQGGVRIHFEDGNIFQKVLDGGRGIRDTRVEYIIISLPQKPVSSCRVYCLIRRSLSLFARYTVKVDKYTLIFLRFRISTFTMKTNTPNMLIYSRL